MFGNPRGLGGVPQDVGHPHLAKPGVKLRPVNVRQALGQQHAASRGFRVNLKRKPLIPQIKIFFQSIDKTLGDIAKGSYVIGKNTD